MAHIIRLHSDNVSGLLLQAGRRRGSRRRQIDNGGEKQRRLYDHPLPRIRGQPQNRRLGEPLPEHYQDFRGSGKPAEDQVHRPQVHHQHKDREQDDGLLRLQGRLQQGGPGRPRGIQDSTQERPHHQDHQGDRRRNELTRGWSER